MDEMAKYIESTYREALLQILPVGVGIVIENECVTNIGVSEQKKVVVANDDGKLEILNIGHDDNLKHGEYLQMIRKNKIDN